MLGFFQMFCFQMSVRILSVIPQGTTDRQTRRQDGLHYSCPASKAPTCIVTLVALIFYRVYGGTHA